MAQLLAGHFGHSVNCAKAHRRESPHKLPAKLLKNTRTRQGAEKGAVHARCTWPAKGGGSIATGHIPSTFVFPTNFPTRTANRSRLEGARSIARIPGMSTFCHGLFSGGRRCAPVSVF